MDGGEQAKRASRNRSGTKTPDVRPRDAEKTKASILRAARDEFCEQGFNGARVDAIADRAKANKRLLYHYFGNKEALYLGVLLDAYQEIRRGERELTSASSTRSRRWTGWCVLPSGTSSPTRGFRGSCRWKTCRNARFVKQIKDIDGSLHFAAGGRTAGDIVKARQRGGHVPHRCRSRCSSTSRSSRPRLLLRLQHEDPVVVFGQRDPEPVRADPGKREAQAVQMVLDYLRPRAAEQTSIRQVRICLRLPL
jgi:AcrR family transcriptional regulator